jgi:hypothetical protein
MNHRPDHRRAARGARNARFAFDDTTHTHTHSLSVRVLQQNLWVDFAMQVRKLGCIKGFRQEPRGGFPAPRKCLRVPLLCAGFTIRSKAVLRGHRFQEKRSCRASITKLFGKRFPSRTYSNCLPSSLRRLTATNCAGHARSTARHPPRVAFSRFIWPEMRFAVSSAVRRETNSTFGPQSPKPTCTPPPSSFADGSRSTSLGLLEDNPASESTNHSSLNREEEPVVNQPGFPTKFTHEFCRGAFLFSGDAHRVFLGFHGRTAVFRADRCELRAGQHEELRGILESRRHDVRAASGGGRRPGL